MKALALVAAAVLACAIVPLQAFSDDDYNWGQEQQGNFWYGYSNSTISFEDSNKTMSYGFSNGTRGDDSHHGGHGPKCAPNDNGMGKHRGEKECDGADPANGLGHAWGKTLNQSWKNFTSQENQGPITPEKNRQGLDHVLRDISANHHANAALGLGHGHQNGHRH